MKDKIKLPNFLIVGGAKCGTTSLYYYLKQHPDIYMSPIKEPKFITSQFLQFPFKGIGDRDIEESIIKSYDKYCELFRDVKDEKIVGEASADNLYYYEKSIYYIKKFLGYPKILIILRNPIERAYSAYLHLLRDNREFLSFEEALKEEEMRRNNNWEFIWYYVDVGFYYKQVKAYLDNFKEVEVCLYDDLKKDVLKLIKEIFNFLEVDDSFEPPNIKEKYNVSYIPKSRLVNKVIVEPNIFKRMLKPFVKIFLKDEEMEDLINYIKAKNLARPEMFPETREYLKRIYYEDILKLQDLIKRDLEHWIK